MPLAKRNGWKWYLVKLLIILFTCCLSVHLLRHFYINLRSICNVIVFLQNGTSMICYKKKMRSTVFHTFLNLVRVLEDFPTEFYAHPPPPPPPPPPYLHPFSDFTFEEVVGGKEPVHWEAPLEGKLDSEVPPVKELS